MIDEAYAKAIDVLKKNITDHGFFASETVYHDVWARDAVITLLGGALLDDSVVRRACRNSLVTLRQHQTELGQIPNCVSYRHGQVTVDYGASYGSAVDATLWYVIGVYYAYRILGDDAFLNECQESLANAMRWLRCQDSDSCGLLETHESGGWMDLLSNRGKVLYDNALWHRALLCYSELIRARNEPEADKYAAAAHDVRTKINSLFWCNAGSDILGANKAYTLVRQSKYYVSYITARDFSWRCDSLANLLTVLFGIAEDQDAHRVVEFMINVGIDQPYLIKALHPVILPGDSEWRDYYVDHSLNLPNQYHNGGIWPYLGGFWVCALSIVCGKAAAEAALHRLAATNKQGTGGPWEFNEWLHGVTGMPMGAPYQAWSASAYILAYSVVKLSTRVPLFRGDIV